jgi:eukaryotic-like serine/threonine-protein kinase
MLQCPRCGEQYSDEVFVCPLDHTPLQADATIADVPRDALLGRVFDGKYRLDEGLGGGGMGTVYRATHLLIDRPVALKVLSQRFVGDQTAQQRFRREARAAGRMQHPNAVTVTDFGATDDGYLYIVMELLEGRTLRDLIAHEAPLDPARAVSFMLQACAAVGAAHDAGLIHRDLKPANIFIEQRPNLPAVVKVLDFGVAKFVVEEHDDDSNTLTQVGALIGTPRYMSPEQCTGTVALTPSADVYSLGIILYEMLTGATPFSGETHLAIALKQVSELPRPPRDIVASIPEALERLILHTLTKNPVERPRNANELRRELFTTAESLGFEHAESPHSPMLETLRSAGTESPSGRLVIDLNTLRQVQAAVGATPAVSEETKPLTAGATNSNHPAISRVSVPVERSAARSNLWIVGVILLIAILGSGVLAARWWNGQDPSVIAQSTPTPAPTPTATPTPTPTPAASKSPAHKRQDQQPNKPSTAKKVWNKLKKALPF